MVARTYFCFRFLRINRNIVECKGGIYSGSKWNVVVLIETLWNVKCKKVVLSWIFFSSINRNIVECKGLSIPFPCSHRNVLIETLWNVKTMELITTVNELLAY